jgi:hypothetical protein
MRKLFALFLAALVGAVGCAELYTYVRDAQAQTTLTSPVNQSTGALTTASLSVLGANPTRKGVIFYNPNASIAVWICPATVTAVANGAGCIGLQAADSFVCSTSQGFSCSSAWNAIAASSSSVKLTILDYP